MSTRNLLAVRPASYVLPALVVANAVLFLGGSWQLRLLGGVMLFCLLPGLALVALVFPRAGFLETVLLGSGASYVISNLVVLLVHFVPGGVSLLLLVLPLDLVVLLLAGLSFWLQTGRSLEDRGISDESSHLAARCCQLAAIIALVSFFRFFNLGYSEFQGDEVGVISVAGQALVGQDDALFLHRKGPLEVTTALAFVTFTAGFDEFALRFPFALASALAVLVVYLIGREMFDGATGFLAGLLLAVEGVYLAFSRMVQYHGLVVLMQTLAVYCFYRLLRDEDKQEEKVWRFQLLGVAFFACGCLAHYDVALVLPVLILLYLGRRFLKGNFWVLLASLFLAVVILAPFYLPFALRPELGGARSYVFGERIGLGGGLHNHFGEFVSYSMFYNSTYYVAFTLLLLALASAGLLPRWAAGFFIVGLLISIFFPATLAVGDFNWSFVLFLPALAAVFFGRWMKVKMKVEGRAVLLWFLCYFVVYSFIVREPGLHYYALSPAWTLLGAVVLKGLYDRLSKARPVAVAAFALCLLLFAGYAYVFFIQSDPEYAMTFPDHKIPLYWTPQTTPPRSGRFGVPRQAGWKTIGYLYRSGLLRGEYDTNERSKTADWYTREILPGERMPRYFLLNEKVKPEGAEWKHSREAIETLYRLAGRVTVHGQPSLLIYEDKNLVQVPDTYPAEEYEAGYEALASLDDYRMYWGADDRHFRQAAAFLEENARPGEGLVLDGAGILSYYYRGDLAYYPLPQSVSRLREIRAEHPRVYALLWATDPHQLDELGSRLEEHRFGAVRLLLYETGVQERK
jgi:4-amino-4-deoxy-L-arabinose transferase-like glycosyltransferase